MELPAGGVGARASAGLFSSAAAWGGSALLDRASRGSRYARQLTLHLHAISQEELLSLHASGNREGVEADDRARGEKTPGPPRGRHDLLGRAFLGAPNSDKVDGGGCSRVRNSTRSTPKNAIPKKIIESPIARNKDRHIARSLRQTRPWKDHCMVSSTFIDPRDARLEEDRPWRADKGRRRSSICAKHSKRVGRGGETAVEMGFLAKRQSICGLRKADETGEGAAVLFDPNRLRIIHV